MVTTNNSSFTANAETAPVDEKQLRTIDTTHYIMEKPSQNSMASATVVASTASAPVPPNEKNEKNEKNGRLSTSSATDGDGLPRTSDLSSPTSVHNHNPFDTDVEAMITHTNSEGNCIANSNSRRSIGCRGLGDSQVWPGQSHWKKKAKEQRMKRSCSCLSRLSKRNRLIVKVLIGLLIVGIAVGVGLGISKPLGAAIWGQRNS